VATTSTTPSLSVQPFWPQGEFLRTMDAAIETGGRRVWDDKHQPVRDDIPLPPQQDSTDQIIRLRANVGAQRKLLDLH
jgi:hypothetical protein